VQNDGDKKLSEGTFFEKRKGPKIDNLQTQTTLGTRQWTKTSKAKTQDNSDH